MNQVSFLTSCPRQMEDRVMYFMQIAQVSLCNDDINVACDPAGVSIQLPNGLFHCDLPMVPKRQLDQRIGHREQIVWVNFGSADLVSALVGRETHGNLREKIGRA